MAEAWAVIAGFATAAFDRARRAGRREPSQAYAADGLLDMARAAAAGARRPGPGAGVEGGAGAETAGVAAAEAETAGVADGVADTEHGAAGPMGTARPDGGTAAGDGNGEVERGRTAPPAGDGPAAAAHAAPAPAPPAPTLPGLGRTRPTGPAAGHPAADHPGGHSPPAPAPAPAPPARSPVPTKVVVRIDWTALVRGWVAEGETCEITGVGPVAVSAVRAMMASGDPFLAAVVTKGVDVVSVAHLGRRPSAFQQTALDWAAPTCRVEGCDAAGRLENDHRHGWAATRLTVLGGIDPLCAGHHDRKTYDGWALVAGTGKRPMVGPDDPRHPRPARASPVPARAPE